MRFTSSCALSFSIFALANILCGANASAQVANDECATAIPVFVNTPLQFDTTTATASADPAPSDSFCPNTYLDWGSANRDVWFSFTPALSGTATFSTCFAGGFDSSIALYTGACGALTQVGCNGDGAADAACQMFHSKIEGFLVSAGTTYTIRVGGWNGTEAGVAALTVTLDPSLAGCPAAGGCGIVHAQPGCNDAVCCTWVCTANPTCCEVSWDANCVQTAVSLCGIYTYQCLQPNPAVENDCAPAARVFAGDSQFTVNNTGCNTDGPNHPASICSAGNDAFLNDVWFRTLAPASGTLRAATCNAANFDTKLAIYDMGTSPANFDYNTLNQPGVLVGCNDDGSQACQAGSTFASELVVTVSQGNWYLIRCASYDLPGTCTLTVDMPEPCTLPLQTGFEIEACGSSSNNGCNAAGQSESITLGSRIKGTLSTSVDPSSGAETRDSDYYRLDIPSDLTVTMNIYSAAAVTGLILSGDLAVPNCGGVSVIAETSGECPATAQACLNPGTYFLFVGPQAFSGIPCGSGLFNDYVLELTSTPSQCPDLLDQTCENAGASTFASSSAAAGGGIVACGVNPAFPNCTTGGTTINSFARPMPAGAVGGSITCLDFGVFSVRRAVNATNTACANFASDIPLPATIGIYADIDGGAPRNKIVADGDGNDLQLIASREVLIPGGIYVANLDFNPPLCLQDAPAGSNIVVTMDCPDLYTAGATPSIPDASGYGIRAGGGTVPGQGSGNYVRLSCADAAGAYVLAETLGATFTAQWIVTLRGNFSSCKCTVNPDTPPSSDCDGDGNVDSCQIAAGAPDANGNGYLDTCELARGDLNLDGEVGSADLSILLTLWGTLGASPADFNRDGRVDSADLVVLLTNWARPL